MAEAFDYLLSQLSFFKKEEVQYNELVWEEQEISRRVELLENLLKGPRFATMLCKLISRVREGGFNREKTASSVLTPKFQYLLDCHHNKLERNIRGPSPRRRSFSLGSLSG